MLPRMIATALLIAAPVLFACGEAAQGEGPAVRMDFTRPAGLYDAPFPSDDLLRDLVELRQIIEPSAAKFAAGRATLTDISGIEKAYEAMTAATTDMSSYARADAAFHLSIFVASHNALLWNLSHVVSGLLRLSFELSQETLNDSDNTVGGDLVGHRDVLEAISRGDGADAEAAMLKVVLNGKAALARRSRR